MTHAFGPIHPLEYTGEQLRDLVVSHGFEVELLASINLTPFSADEKAAMFAVRQTRASRLGDHPGEFGEKWLLFAALRRAMIYLDPVHPDLGVHDKSEKHPHKNREVSP